MFVDLYISGAHYHPARDKSDNFNNAVQLLRIRGTQLQFLENIFWEDDLRSIIFGTFVVKFLACLLLLGFSKRPKMV